MEIGKIVVGTLRCNCYLLNKGDECLIVDPGDEYTKIKEAVSNKHLIGILLTHHHFDHTGCIDDLIREYNIPLYDYQSFNEQEQMIGNFKFEVIRTYGHTMDSVSYYFKEDKVMFTGDFLFFDTIGRCDLPGGDIEQMKKSIQKIKQYDDDIIIYPGHGKKTNLGREKRENVYFKNNY